MDDVDPNQLIGAIESNSLEYTSSDILDYAKKENGVHLQIGLRAKVLTFNMFINATKTTIIGKVIRIGVTELGAPS